MPLLFAFSHFQCDHHSFHLALKELCELSTKVGLWTTLNIGLEKRSRSRHLRQRLGRAPVAASISKPFKYKKGEYLKRLILLKPKRQIRSLMRHNETFDRQKSVALLTLVCQCADCGVTKMEVENDG